jgi:putative transposase
MRTRETTYFVTSVTEGRRNYLQANAQIVCEALLQYRDAGNYLLHAFVVMPNHFHALITPGPEIALEKCTQLIKGGSSRRMAKGKIWQKGFNQQGVRDANGYAAFLKYIEENPERRGLREWPFVFSKMNMRLDPPPEYLRAFSG